MTANASNCRQFAAAGGQWLDRGGFLPVRFQAMELRMQQFYIRHVSRQRALMSAVFAGLNVCSKRTLRRQLVRGPGRASFWQIVSSDLLPDADAARGQTSCRRVFWIT
jgi:hypothetical protein